MTQARTNQIQGDFLNILTVNGWVGLSFWHGRDFGGDDEGAVGAGRISPEIVLMVFLCGPKLAQRDDLGDDPFRVAGLSFCARLLS